MEKFYMVFYGMCLAGIVIAFLIFAWSLIPDFGKTRFKLVKAVRWTKKHQIRRSNGRFDWIKFRIVWR
jgi:hypothetical protein